MPYIKQERRRAMDMVIRVMALADIRLDGDLEYVLYYFCRDKIIPSYNNYKNFCGELEQCAVEIERRNDMPYQAPLQEPFFPKPILKYLAPVIRASHSDIIEAMEIYEVVVDGDLNYILYAYVKRYLSGYNSLRLFCNSLRRCVWEIQCRLLASYEDEKIKENGDIEDEGKKEEN